MYLINPSFNYDLLNFAGVNDNSIFNVTISISKELNKIYLYECFSNIYRTARTFQIFESVSNVENSIQYLNKAMKMIQFNLYMKDDH